MSTQETARISGAAMYGVLSEVAIERVTQGGPSDPAGPEWWDGPEAYVVDQYERFTETLSTRNLADSRAELVRLAARAVAAIEAIDRQTEQAGDAS